MPRYSALYNFLLTLWISVVKFAKLSISFVNTNASAPLIALPVTSPTFSSPRFTIAREFKQRFIITPITTLRSAVHDLLRQASYTVFWHIPMYMRQIAKSLYHMRVTFLKSLANGLLRLAKAMHDTSEHPRWNRKNHDPEPTVHIHIRESRSIDPPRLSIPVWQGYQNFASNTEFVYAPLSSNVSTVHLDQPALATSNGPGKNASTPVSEGALSSDSNWGLTSSTSFLGSESSSVDSHSSLVTPSQSPANQTFFTGLAYAGKDIDDGNMDITEGISEPHISLAAIAEDRNRVKELSIKLSAMGMNASTTSIHSFGQIERLFEDNYGKAAALAADEFFTTLGKRGIIAPPAPVTVFSARVSYDTSPRSALNMRLNALVSGNNSANSSFESACPNNTVMEEDITTVDVADVGNCFLDLSLTSISDSFVIQDASSPDSDRSSVELSTGFSPHVNLMDDDASFILAYRDSLARSSIMLSPQDSVLSQYSQESALENSPFQSSAASSPFDAILTPAIPEPDARSSDPSRPELPFKGAYRSARAASGLAIDIKTLSPSYVSAVNLPSPTVGSALRSTSSDVSIPSIVVSPVSEDTDSLASNSPDLSVDAVVSISQKELVNMSLGEMQPPRFSNVYRSVPTQIDCDTSAHSSPRAQSIVVPAGYRSPSRTAARDSNSRRVGLRGSLPRYRFSTPPEPTCERMADTLSPSPSPSIVLTEHDRDARRVGLLGTKPRQRFAETLSPPNAAPASAKALIARAAHEERERAAVLERHQARAQFFAQRDAAHGPGLRPLLLPMSVAARERGTGGRSVSPTRFWGMPF